MWGISLTPSSSCCSPAEMSTTKKKSLKKNSLTIDGYLLGLCLEYDWERVERYCKFLIKIFQRPTNQHATLKLAGINQLLATDQWGNSCLHIVCHRKPPPYTVVAAILKAASIAPGGPLNLHTSVNLVHVTPLLIACTSGVSTRVIHELLNPPKGMQCGGAAVTMADDRSYTVFLALMNRYEMFRKIPSLRSKSLPLENVQSVVVDSSSSCSPDDGAVLIQQQQDHCWSLADAPNPIGDYCPHIPIFQSFWSSVDTLIQAAWWSQCDGSERTSHLRSSFVSMVHGAAYVSECLPPKLIDLILRVHHLDIMVATKVVDDEDDSQEDEEGLLAVHPLHLAITTNQPQPQSQIHRRLAYQRSLFIERLLELDPSSARRPVPGTRKRSPLCQAIDSGLQWHIQEPDDSSTTILDGPVKRLWQVAPEALDRSDPMTGLYPFQLAASVQSSRSSTLTTTTTSMLEEEEDDVFQLDTIYNLLRLHPQQVRHSQ
jgi:hypothetical protein